MRLIPLLALGLLLPLVSQAAEPAQERAQVGAKLEDEKTQAAKVEKARLAAAAELKSIQQQTAKAAADLQAAEQKLSDLEDELAALQTDIAVGEAALKEDEAQLNQTLAALLRLSRRPPETALLEPGQVVDRLRTARLLGDLGKQVDEKAKALRVQLDALAKLYAQTEEATVKAEAATKALQARQVEMAALLKKRQIAVKKLDKDLDARQRNIKNLMAKAKSLDEVMAALALQRAAGLPHPRPDPLAPRTQAQSRRAGGAVSGGGSAYLPKYIATHDFSQLRGRLVLPARGKIVGRFGSHSANNATGLKGLEVTTRPGAQVVIPAEGEILYSGPFRSYGGLLIVDVGRGYHMLIAGLDRIDAVVGQRLLAGEPIGAMSNEPHKSQNLAQLSATDGSHFAKTGAGKSGARNGGSNISNPRLYFELRKAGEPIDPWGWLAPGEKR